MKSKMTESELYEKAAEVLGYERCEWSAAEGAVVECDGCYQTPCVCLDDNAPCDPE